MSEFIVKTAEEMLEIGRKICREKLSSHCVVALIGDLGAGKTHLSQGICHAFGYENVTSPTFSLVNEHQGKERDVFHFDFYRLESVEELYDLGWDDYLERSGLVIAEWANLYSEVFPENTLWIKIEHIPEGRKITLRSSLRI